MMKIILLKDLKGIGRVNDVINAKDGYALNYLIPKKFALPATPSAIKNAELKHKQFVDRTILDNALLTKDIEFLASANILIRKKANEKGHLYDGVGESEIKAAVFDQTRIELPDGIIRLEKPLKEIGTFDVAVSAPEAFGKFSITIEPE